jgi:hypothetical protein
MGSSGRFDTASSRPKISASDAPDERRLIHD